MRPWRAIVGVGGAPIRIFALVAALALVSASSLGGRHRISSVAVANTESMDIAAPQVEAGAPTATLGVYYFGGWSGSLENYHFNGMLSGPYEDRQPLYGWLDNSKSTMRTQLYWASKIGIRFFDFLWYYNPETIPGEDAHLNDALGNYAALENHQGVDFAITYVNGGPFVVPQESWHDVVEGWVKNYFTDPDYMRIDGKPLFVIHHTTGFFVQHGGDAGANAASGDAAVNAALDELQTVAQEHGLPGVFVIGGEYVSDLFDWNYFPEPTLGENYDALNSTPTPLPQGSSAANASTASLHRRRSRHGTTSPRRRSTRTSPR